MSADKVVEVTQQGWFSRLGESIKGVIFGLVLILGSVVLLFWNEGRAVRTAKTLEEGAASVVTVLAEKIEPSNDGKLVHLTGSAETAETLSDPDFALSLQGLRLRRNVEMYQWKEKTRTEERNKLGGGTERVTTYEYEKGWSSSIESSSDFKEPSGHQNPSVMRYEGREWVAEKAMLGAFTLDRNLISLISAFQPKIPTEEDLQRIPEGLRREIKKTASGFYVGADPANPAVGDLRISFDIVPNSVVSIVGRQAGGTFAAYQTQAGGEILMVESGNKTAAQMFTAAERANTMMTWILRLVGLVLCWIGFSMVFRPIVVVADVIPLIGSIVGLGTGLASIVCAAPISLLTIAVAWIFFRPLLGIALVVLALAVIGGGVYLGTKARSARATG